LAVFGASGAFAGALAGAEDAEPAGWAGSASLGTEGLGDTGAALAPGLGPSCGCGSAVMDGEAAQATYKK
jgi:hypothetical protein